MGQILSSICGEKFVTSPATLGYSNDGYGLENEAGIGSALRPWNWKGDDSDEEEKPLIIQSSRGVVFQTLIEIAAKKVVEDCSKKYESIIGKKETVDGYSLGNEAGIEISTIPVNGDIDKPAIFQVSSEPVEKKGDDDNPLTFNGTEQRKEVCHNKDEAINKKWKKKIVEDSRKNEAIVEDGASLLLQKEHEEKPLIFQSSGGPVLQVHIDPDSKKGNGKPLADQKNKQRKEVKNVAINKPLNHIWRKKETVEDRNINEAILIKSSNVTKKKETIEDGNNNEAILIKSSNVTKKKENVEDLCKNEAIIKSLNATKKKKGDDEKNVIFQLRRAVYQICIEPSAKQIVEDDDDSCDGYILGNEADIQTGSVFREPVEEKGNADNSLTDHKNKQRKEVGSHKNDQAIDKELAALNGDGKPLVVQKSKQRKEVSHQKDMAINKKWKKVVEDDGISINTSLLLRKEDKDKPLIFQSSRGTVSHVLVEPLAKKGNGKQDQCNKQIKEVSHHKDVATNKRRGKKKNKIVDKEKPLINESFCGTVFQVNIKSALKDDSGKPLTNQSNNKACTSMWKKKTVEDKGNHVNFKEPIARKRNNKPKMGYSKDEAINKAMIIEEGKPDFFQSLKKSDAKMINDKPLVDFSNKQMKENVHHNETINKALIVINGKLFILQSLVEPAARKLPLIDKVKEEKPVIFEALSDNKPLADFSNNHIKEICHHKIDFINNEIVWLKHYNNKQKILMVGEGDFSFSASLAMAFGSSASNITATSLNNLEYLRFSYKNATKNIEKLRNRGATVRHGVDATKMSNYSYWKGIKFDRIIYNFPYSGCPKSESRQTQLRQHLELVRGFLVNAKEMLEEDGEIHISHKTNGFHSDWRLKDLAWTEGLWLVEEAKFNKSDYPGYQTKQGYNGDNNFDCYPSSTYMFASTGIGN